MKNNQRHVYSLILVLFLVSSGVFLYRHLVLDVPLTDTETVNSWMVESNLHFTADKSTPIKASFTIPYLPPHFAILDEYFVSRSYGVTTNLNGANRETVWSIRRGHGAQSLYYRAIVRQTANDESALAKPSIIQSQALTDNEKSAIETITSQVRESSADSQTFAQSTIRELNKQDGNAKLLIGNEFNEERIINAAILILHQSKISAVSVKGIYLNQPNKTEFKSLLAVYNGETMDLY